MDNLVNVTNRNAQFSSQLTVPKKHSRALKWHDTMIADFYIFFTIKMYMGLYKESRLEDFWDTKQSTPDHIVSRYMASVRCQEGHVICCVWRRVRVGTYALG
jgi:hypothetical protein